MSDRRSLFEYLAVPVDPRLSGSATRVTEADHESYDEDGALLSLGLGQGDATAINVACNAATNGVGAPLCDEPGLDATLKTFTDGETYDDDPGLEPMAMPRALLVDSTIRTSTQPETYDDNGIHAMGIAASPLEQTTFTRVDNETTDDDQGYGSLSTPRS